MPANFALIGAAGYVAPRHVEAIRATRNRLVLACDPHDAVGVLDRASLDVRYARDPAQFERELASANAAGSLETIDYVSICTPNHLHQAHVRLALGAGAHAVCEKPLVLDLGCRRELEALERASGRRVHAVLQLREHPGLIALRQRLSARGRSAPRSAVTLTYVTARGPWFGASWKGVDALSGGIVTKIGVHFLDLLLWLFGPLTRSVVHLQESTRKAGRLELARADVSWLLSLDAADLPFPAVPGERTSHRVMTVDGEDIDLGAPHGDLHTRVYERVLAGGAPGLDDAWPSLELAASIRAAHAIAPLGDHHPLVSHPRASA